MKREIVLGPPGTGKTQEMLRRVEIAIAGGMAPEEIGYFAFTKKAAEVAVSRALENFNLGSERFPYFRTLHSLAFRELRLSTGRVLQEGNLKEFGDKFGWEFTTRIDQNNMEPRYGVGLGDSLLRTYDMARSRGVTPAESALLDGLLEPAQTVQFFCDQLDAYKVKHNLVSFSDFMQDPVSLPRVRMVIVDEAQDLTRQQWSFVKRSFADTPEIVFAGDDDQAIYQWSGADVGQFLRLEADLTQLRKSYRCRRKIWEVCNRVARHIGNRYDKDWQPAEDGGAVEYFRDPNEVDISSGEWLILVRTNRQKQRYWHVLMKSGRVFHDGVCWTNEQAWFRGAVAYMRLRAGGSINGSDAAVLQKVCPGARLRGAAGMHDVGSFDWAFDVRDTPWERACVGLLPEQTAFLARAVRLNEPLSGPGNVRLSTIHGAKGGEADNVLLDAQLGGIPLQQYEREPDSERRVWYVAVSRARHRLVIVGGARGNRALELA